MKAPYSPPEVPTRNGAIDGPVIVRKVLHRGPEAVEDQPDQEEEERQAEAECNKESISKAWPGTVD